MRHIFTILPLTFPGQEVGLMSIDCISYHTPSTITSASEKPVILRNYSSKKRLLPFIQRYISCSTHNHNHNQLNVILNLRCTHCTKMTLDPVKIEYTTSNGTELNSTTIESGSGPQTNAKQPSTNLDDPDLICPVCNCPSISSCRNCKKISYCGKAHQRFHWKIHKSQCFPLIHQYDPILGSRLLATRNIKAGEIIWKEKSLLSGPDLASDLQKEEFSRLCLGCYRVVNSDYSCPSCSWSMCGPNCDGKGDHEKLECKIFTSAHTAEKVGLDWISEAGESPLQHCRYKYGAITILRGVLFKELDPPRWKNILDLDNMWNGIEVECDNFVNPPITSSRNPTTDFGQFCHEFIMSLNPPNVTNEDVALILRVVSHRRCEVYKDELLNLLQHGPHTTNDNKPHAFHLFSTACQASQNCVPNSSWIIQQDPVEIQLRALLPIQFGRTVTLSYANVEEDILGRQTGESTTFSCKCARCQDELDTFFSALKCPGTHENSTESVTTNWLLPTPSLMWSCHECGLTLESKCYARVVAEIKKDFYTIVLESSHEKVGDSGSWRLKLIENLENVIQKHSPNSVHPNHATMFKVEMTLLQQLSVSLAEADLTDDKWTRMVERFTNLCRKWLEVGDVLWPGLSRQRGQLLYYYQQALIIQLIFSISRRMRGESLEGEDPEDAKLKVTEGEETKKQDKIQDLRHIQQSLLEKQFHKILSIRKVVVDIFCYDQVDQVGRKYADSLAGKSREIELLKLYVFQNCCNKQPNG